MTDIATAARTLIDAYGGNVPDWLATEVADLESAIDEQIQIPRTPTDAMMDAGLYHCSADMTHSDLHTAFQAMFDAVTLDGGCSTHAPAQVETKTAEEFGLTEAEQNLAMSYGWCMITCDDGQLIIEADSDSTIFASNDDAYDHVAAEAERAPNTDYQALCERAIALCNDSITTEETTND